MSYVPNASDATQPLPSTPASTAAAEFRALKARINGLDLTTADRAIIAGVPKTITVGAIDSGGVGFRLLRVTN